LARLYPDTKFLRVRAAALGFASTTSVTQVQTSILQRLPRSSLRDGNDDDPYGDDDLEENEDEIVEDEDGIDLDVLPTMLVYRDGELVHNWVRVDWEVGQAGVEELLDRLVLVLLHYFRNSQGYRYRCHILPRTQPSANLGLPSDDEDDFDITWSDDEL
jgi:hypothetical protein